MVWDRTQKTSLSFITFDIFSVCHVFVSLVTNRSLWFTIDKGMLLWRSVHVLQSWCPVFKSSLCNSFEDRASVDLIYGCPIFKVVSETWQGTRILAPAIALVGCPHWNQLDWVFNRSSILLTLRVFIGEYYMYNLCWWYRVSSTHETYYNTGLIYMIHIETRMISAIMAL